MRRLLVILVLLGAVGGAAGYWYWKNNGEKGPTFRTATVVRGNLQAVIGATGTLEPEEVIDVGAQVAGRIERFGRDLREPTKTIDYGSTVEETTVLAQLDDALYVARRDSAKADLEKAKADLEQMQAKFMQAKRDLDRARSLVFSKALAAAEYDAAQAMFDTAKASVAVGEAQILQAKAALKETETNLAYTVIRSPVKGVIIDRRVNVGQTVVASLSAPSLFLIAKDLRKMQIWAAVNEADIGQIKIGQPVRFTVDALPGRTFEGKVLKQGDYPARLNASMTQNVVTYTVVIGTDNSDGALLPYQTANLKFVVADRVDVLLVPNSALRYRPRPDQIDPEHRVEPSKRKVGGKAKDSAEAEGEAGTVWVRSDEGLRPIRVRTGHSDGLNTEILAGDLKEGDELILGEGRTSPQGGGETNPFAPTIMRGKKKGDS